ncbi:serine protease nudel [Episyrphus balteatus]|uniref:serine protease nudel n=1 Tax=Episyrphus balteatus TaxID=286459 RepID=UPI002485E2CD|nr:serine protease nudel [Episyrphus balteatus]
MTSKTHILLDEEYEDQKSHFKPRWPRHSFARILILSALVLIALLLTVLYYGEYFQTEEVLHGTMHINSAHTVLKSSSKFENIPSRKRIKKQLIEELFPEEIVKKWSKFQHHRYQRMRFKRDLISDEMIDPMESDFNELRIKIRDKRTKIELSKLEKDYAKCKQEALSHSDCMDTFIKMYKIAKDISEKMEKMKQIFRDSEIHLHANSMSSSMEKYLDKKKALKPKEKVKEEEVLYKTTEKTKQKLKKLIQDDADELIPSDDVWVEEDKLPLPGFEVLKQTTEKVKPGLKKLIQGDDEELEEDKLPDTAAVEALDPTTESPKQGLKKLVQDTEDELIPSDNVWIKDDQLPVSKVEIQDPTTESAKPGLKKLVPDGEDELIPSDDVWVKDDKLPVTVVEVLNETTESTKQGLKKLVPDGNDELIPSDDVWIKDDKLPVTGEEILDPTTESSKHGLRKLVLDDGRILWVKKGTLPSLDKKPVFPVTLNTSIDESKQNQSENLNIEDSFMSEIEISSTTFTSVINETTDEISFLDIQDRNGSTTLKISTEFDDFDEVTDNFKVDPLDMIQIEKPNKTTDYDSEPMTDGFEEIDSEFVTSSEPTTFRFEESPKEIDTKTTLDLDFGLLEENSSTTESFHTVSDELFDQGEVTSSTDSWKQKVVTDTFSIDLSEDFIDQLNVTSEGFNTATENFENISDGTEGFENIDQYSSTSVPVFDEFLEISSTSSDSLNEDQPGERSNDNIQPGIKTVLSNYTTDVEITYSGKCVVTTTTTTVSITTPPQNSTTEDCQIQDPLTEGPMTEELPQARKPTKEELTTTSKTPLKEHPLDDPSSKENMLDEEKASKLTTTTLTSVQKKWLETFKEGSKDASKNLTEITNTNSELIDTFGETDDMNVHKFGPKMNPNNMATGASFKFCIHNLGNNKQLMTLCDYLAKQTRSKVTSSPEQSEDITPSPNIQFTSRGPGFPVTGETMKASAQFFINPNFGVPSIPVCFYITPASFRMMMQPFWSPFFGMQGLGGGGNTGGSGNSGNGGVFIVPPSFGNMQNSGNFFGHTSPSGSGSQGNIPNIFSKSASSQQQQQKQQQFFCTYMQNSGKQSGSVVNNRGFNSINFKLRNSSGNVSSPSDIIYSSYWNKLPGYHGSNLGQADRFQCPIDGDVPCYGGHECVPEKKWCDGTVDCSDGSDEAACTCRNRILQNRICDGYQDCPLGEDEIGCFGCENFMYSCYDNEEEFQRANRSTLAMCYSSAERCDGVRNCINGRDEMGCNLIVGDLTHHMSHAASGSSGFLYRNYHGEWYPVCNNAHRWAREACSEELGVLAEDPSITFQEVEVPGPFIESHHSGGSQFSDSCQKRDGDKLSDIAAHVMCPQPKCGIIQELTSPLMRSRRRRRRRHISESLTDESRIVGGTYSEPLQWPFVVAVYRNGDFHCGGTIFSEQWIITAAHCTIKFENYFYEVRAGMLRRSSFSSSTQIHHVTHVVVHQMYERRTMKNDLALLRIDTPLRFNRWVKPICLPDLGRTTMGSDWIWGPEVNTICTVVGWGAVREKGPGSDRLKEVQLPIRRRCTEKDDQEAEDICAGEAVGGRDACQGDSGGPLFCRSVSNNNEWYLAGVVSHGNGCARASEFGVYTRVALYLDWIAMAMKPEFLPKVQPKQLCPGYVCIWGGKRCLHQSKRCDRLVDCLGGEDEVGCIYNYIPDVGAGVGTGRNASTTLVDVMDEADQDGTATTTETDGRIDGKNFNGATDTEPSSLEMPDDNMAIESTDDDEDETTNSPSSTLLVETISEKVVTIVENSESVGTSVDPITELNPLLFSPSTFFPISSETDQSKLKGLAVKFLDTIELQIATTAASTEGLDANTSPLTTSSSGVTSITGFGDFQADLGGGGGEVSSESSTAVHKRENATEKETAPAPTPALKLKTMPKKIAQKFVCEKIPQIIDIGNRCDRIADCEDGTDEDGCTCRQYLKGPLNILICDGKIDCEDFTDEDDCGNCTSTQFPCPLSKTCINSTSRCDDIVDCQFKEDEKDCFALTNGREIHLDSLKQPKLQSAGIFSRNFNGQWRVVCSHETDYHEHVAKTAEEVCSLLGFKGAQFHNTTEITQATIVPIDPDLVQMEFPKSRHAVGDSGHFSKHSTHHLTMKLPPVSPRSERLEKSSIGNCQGLFIECVPKSNGSRPLKTLTPGNEIIPKTLDIPGFKPSSNKNPTTISELFADKKDEILDKLNKLIDKKKTVLVHDKLHEGVEKEHWPWLVSVYANGELWCIGVLVDKHWVLVHESCYIGVSLDTDYVTVLLGGGKSKQTLHKSPHEQIKRVDCFDTVDNSDVMLLHLDNAAHFTRHVLPTFLPDMILTEKDKGKSSNKCMSVMHDKFGGIKVTPTMDKLEATICSKDNELSCYQWDPKAIVDFKLKHFGKDDDGDEEKQVTSSRTKTTHGDPDGDEKSLLDFCKDLHEDSLSYPYNQGVIVCREENTGWYPMAYYTFNASECNNLKKPFAVRTLDKVYSFIQDIIDQPKCKNSEPRPRPHCPSLRCPLGNCLLPDQMCNGKVDCHDGSDEETEFCRLHRNECKASELKCRSSGKCIPKTKFCDDISDCEDLTDEPTICSCFTYLQATDPSKICDGIRNCWDKSDESSVLCNCTSDRFPCGSSRSECIPRDFVCDKEPDCPNGEDERYCYGIEQPIKSYSSKPQPPAAHTSGYGQVTEQSYGVWHTKCFPRHRPPDSNEVAEICRKLGYNNWRPPSYRLIDDNADIVAATHVEDGGFTKSPGKYRDATKAVVINKFSPLHLNEDLTLIMKPSRPIAQLVKWNQTDSSNCYRLEVKCN